MSNAVKTSMEEWKIDLRQQLDAEESRISEKASELQVLKAKLEVLEEAVDKIEDGIERENFYNELVARMQKAIEIKESEIQELRSDRKKLSNRVKAIVSTIDSMTF